jgi:hypothetical protein
MSRMNNSNKFIMKNLNQTIVEIYKKNQKIKTIESLTFKKKNSLISAKRKI